MQVAKKCRPHCDDTSFTNSTLAPPPPPLPQSAAIAWLVTLVTGNSNTQNDIKGHLCNMFTTQNSRQEYVNVLCKL